MNELLESLCQFVGYGSPTAKAIFIGREEYTYDDNPDVYRKRLEIQRRLQPYADLGELCSQLTGGLHNPMKCEPQRTWAPLCSVMLGISGSSIASDNQTAIIEYQKKKLGRSDSDSLLVELLPVPKSTAKSFRAIHASLLGFGDLETYHRSVLPDRQTFLAKILAKHFTGQSPPRLILGYGKPWGRFEAIFEQARQMLNWGSSLQYNSDELWFRWAKMKDCLFFLTFHPACQDKRRFDFNVAKRIAEIYHKEFGRLPPVGKG
jgi:hypothetical protein